MKILLSLAFFLIVILTQGQNKQLLYDVRSLPQSLMSNPGAAINFDKHIGIPFLSQIHFSAGTSGVNLYDIFNDSNPNVNERVSKAIRKLTSDDYFTAREQLEILSFGWRLKNDHYISMGIYQEMDAFAYFPKDPAMLVNEGNKDHINVPFNFSHVSFTGEAMAVYHVGLNKKINYKLSVGGRLKIYSGIFNVESTNNSGYFTTIDSPEGPNYYRHFADKLNVRVNTSGYKSLKEGNKTVKQATLDLLKRSFFGGNIGVGVDLGLTYKIEEHFIVTGSVQDLGLMFQKKDVENYLYYGSYQTDGIEPLFPDAAPGGPTLPYWDIFEDEVNKNLKDETINEAYISWRPFILNASLEYGFGKFYQPCNYLVPVNRRAQNLVGIHLFGINRPKGLKYAFNAYFDRKFTQNFRMKFAYTVDDFSYSNLGLLVSTRLKNFNFYLAGDNLLGYFNLAKSNSESIQLGFQFVFNKY